MVNVQASTCSLYSTLFCLIQAHNMINVGLLGLSSFAVTKMIPALADSPYLNLYGVASRSRDKANFFSAQHKCWLTIVIPTLFLALPLT